MYMFKILGKEIKHCTVQPSDCMMFALICAFVCDMLSFRLYKTLGMKNYHEAVVSTKVVINTTFKFPSLDLY